MKYISEELDDPIKKDCGRCSNCEGRNFFKDKVEDKNVIDAEKFLRGEILVLRPRKQWPEGIVAETRKKIPKEHQNEEGRVLCNYGDSGWGKYVKEDKYINNYFREELVDATVDLIKNKWNKETEPTWVTSVPSLRRPELVKSFAKRVAEKLGVPYIEAIVKTQDTKEQKYMKNSYKQTKNAQNGFVLANVLKNQPVLLIDDMVDSKWTMTICGEILRRNGSGEVYPFAIASTAEGGLD